MAGEKVLLIEDSVGVQEITKAVMEEHGFRVTVSGNGLAALTHPQLNEFDLLLIDAHMNGMDGFDTTRLVKTDAETFSIPVLLLVDKDKAEDGGNQTLRGANGFLVKPFTPQGLLLKVQEILEEQRLKKKSEEYLIQIADRHMQELAEQKIQQAVEKKIQIIVERAIQSIVSIIDQRARTEVEARVTSLTAEKEQELVRMTVQEVARSMVEKLAEKKVAEAMESILLDQTEKTVRRAADAMLPQMVRERLKESIENALPREIQARVQKAAEGAAREISENIVQIITQQAQKILPVVAKEKMPEMA
jgi:CheY-like chemotaxis protein